MEKELQFQFYQGECASSMRYENNSKVYTFAMDNVMPFGLSLIHISSNTIVTNYVSHFSKI